MSYLYWYFGIGVVVVLAVYIPDRLKEINQKPNLRETENSLNRSQDKWHYKLREKILFPLSVVVIAPWIWPVFIYLQVQELIAKKKRDAEQKAQEFSIIKSDLVERMSTNEIEELEIVVDPLGAAPGIPFGHLNSAWKKFIANAQNEDEFWSFKTMWKSSRGKKACFGYAILRGDAVPHHLLLGWTNIPPPKPTAEEIEKRLTDKSDWARSFVVEDRKIKLTPVQIERALKDKSPEVRLAIAKRKDIIFTPEQMERGLTDKNDFVRSRIVCRPEFAPTRAQFDRGLKDSDDLVRYTFASYKTFIPTPVQIDQGLTDLDAMVREAFASRDDCALTYQQIERGITDEDDYVRNIFAERKKSLLRNSDSILEVGNK